MTFENYALYPHMRVFDNMAYPLRLVRGAYTEEEIKKRVVDVAKMLHIDPLLDRFPAEASGGQKQRIALGRTMVQKPSVYLLDEPLAHLDANIRVEFREEFHKIEELIKTTTVYVTHDYTEALSLGDRIMILQDGEILQVDTSDNIYYHLISLDVARQVGQPTINTFTCTIEKQAGDIILRSKDSTKLAFKLVKSQHSLFEHYDKDEVILGIRPKDIGLNPLEKGQKINSVVETFQPLGSEGILTTKVYDQPFVGLIDPESDIAHGDNATLYLETRFFYFFDAQNFQNLEIQ
jgi:ABC-type sugar transport system ATPase subunit